MDLLSDKPPLDSARRRRALVRRRALRTLALLACLGVAFVAGALAYRGGLLHAVKRSLVAPTPMPTPQCAVDAVDPPVLEITMGSQAYRKIVAQREEYLQGGLVMSHSDAELVKAYVRLGDRDLPLAARVRLTGNMVDRIRDPKKWSFRIELQDDGRLLGMTRFNIQPPWARDYMSEWYYMRALRHEGLIASRYSFVRVRLNNEDLGIYGLEEVAGAPLVENNARPAGVVLRFEQSTFWQEWAAFTDAVKTNGGTGSGSLDAANVKPYGGGALADSVAASRLLTSTEESVLSQDFFVASALLESFRRGELSASQVFDVDLAARMYALTDLMGAWHTLNWNMMRFYYNPITGRIEPVGINGFNDYTGASIQDVGLLGTGVRTFSFPDTQAFIARLFDDQAFAGAYVSELERLSSPAWLDGFFADAAADARNAYSIMALEAPQASCATDVFYANAAFIRQVLNPDTKGVQAYLQSSAIDAGGSRTITLALANMQHLPVEVLELARGHSTLDPLDGAPVVLPGRRGAMEYTEVSYTWPAELEWSVANQRDLTLAYHLLGTSAANHHETDVFAWPYSLSDALIEQVRAEQQPNADSFPFLQVDAAAEVIRILPGDWAVTRTVIVPAGFELQCGPGTRLSLSAGASIVSRSPLRWIGEPEAPIVLNGDGTGGGLLVLNSPLTSTLQYVSLDGLGVPQVNGIALEGSVTFYDAPSRWLDCEVLHAHGGAALHAVSTRLVMQEALIQDADGVGLLLERSEGALENVALARTGQDALVLVGANVQAQRLTIDRAGMCAVRASQGSSASLIDVVAQDCRVGLASLDSADVAARQVVLKRCGIGLAAYQRDMAWGPGQLSVTALTAENVAEGGLREVGSSLSVDGQPYGKVAERVVDTLAQAAP